MILLNLGYGYLAYYLSKEAIAKGALVYGISSQKEKKEFIKSNKFKLLDRKKTDYTISIATHLVVSAPPSDDGCPIIKTHIKNIIASNIRCVVYLSSTGVYGDHGGAWVTELSATNSDLKKNRNRIKAENDWVYYTKKEGIKLIIFRLSGIYGPGRNIFERFYKTKLIIKKGHFFSRIHVYDAARVIFKSMLVGTNECLWNLSDEEPTSQENLVTEASFVSGYPLPEKVYYEEEKYKMNKNMRNFWDSNKKVSGVKILKELRISLIFSNYKAGLKSLCKNFL